MFRDILGFFDYILKIIKICVSKYSLTYVLAKFEDSFKIYGETDFVKLWL